MKIFIILIMIVLFSTQAYGLNMSTRPCANALAWYLKDMGKLDGATLNTTYDTTYNQYKITAWVVAGVAEPTGQDLEDIIDDYEQYLIDEAAEKVQDKDKTKTKLGMSDKQLEELKRALEITP